MLIIPIRTESEIHRTPNANYILLGVNAAVFLLDNILSLSSMELYRNQFLAFHSGEPRIYQFITYQFLHADALHLLGNMLFLWVFGNSVNAKMGDLPYILFYLAGGVFAAWGFAIMAPSGAQLVGASGAIAAITTAYLALFPRSQVTVLVWLFVFVRFFQIPALLLIGLKIIVWDNVIAPGLGGAGSIAHSAHLAGYLFGFSGALLMLLIRALPRDQFDIFALWKRWRQRREFATAMAGPGAAERARLGSVARISPQDEKQQKIEEERFERINDLRSRITERLERGDMEDAAELYEELISDDERQRLSQRHQLDIARYYYGLGRSKQAADAFERYVAGYAHTVEASEVRLLLGIVYARDLQEYETADKHLTKSMELLRDSARRGQCLEWLTTVRSALGRPAPES